MSAAAFSLPDPIRKALGTLAFAQEGLGLVSLSVAGGKVDQEALHAAVLRARAILRDLPAASYHEHILLLCCCLGEMTRELEEAQES